MTDCDITDATLNDVAAFATDHLPAGSAAVVQRGRAGSPHTLWVNAPALVLDQPGALPHNPERSFKFYDRLSVTRWLLSTLEGARVTLRDSFGEGEIPADVSPRLRELSDLAGKLMSERHRLEAKGGSLPRIDIGGVISEETCRANGVTMMGAPS